MKLKLKCHEIYDNQTNVDQTARHVTGSRQKKKKEIASPSNKEN